MVRFGLRGPNYPRIDRFWGFWPFWGFWGFVIRGNRVLRVYTNTQIHKYTNTQIHENTRIYENTRIHELICYTVCMPHMLYMHIGILALAQNRSLSLLLSFLQEADPLIHNVRNLYNNKCDTIEFCYLLRILPMKYDKLAMKNLNITGWKHNIVWFYKHKYLSRTR